MIAVCMASALSFQGHDGTLCAPRPLPAPPLRWSHLTIVRARSIDNTRVHMRRLSSFAGDLKEGPCGPTFVHAFGCFIRSEHEDKGMDCLEEFKAFQVPACLPALCRLRCLLGLRRLCHLPALGACSHGRLCTLPVDPFLRTCRE